MHHILVYLVWAEVVGTKHRTPLIVVFTGGATDENNRRKEQTKADR